MEVSGMKKEKKAILVALIEKLENKQKPSKEEIAEARLILTTVGGGLKIKCVSCNELKAVRPDVLEKRIEKFGSEEKLRAKYECIKCRPKKVKETKKEEKKDAAASTEEKK